MTISDASRKAAGTTTAAAGAAAETTSETGERRRARIAGLALIASPILWFVGAAAFRSQVGGFYDNYDADPLMAMRVVDGQQAAWIVQTLIFFAGTAAALVGLAILARQLWHTRAGGLARAGVLGSVAVAGLFIWMTVMRLTAPMDGVRTAADVPTLMIAAHHGWLGVLTSALTMVTVGIFGAALFWTGRARVTGAVVAVLCGLVLVVLLTSGTLPPVVIYPIAAILGVRLLFRDPLLAR